jgi:predicted SAM-dependent methyltransferase
MVSNSIKRFLPLSVRNRYRSQLYQANQEIKAICGKSLRQFIRPPFPNLENGEINLHLGCGSVNHPKFINIDGLPAPHVHYIRAIDNLSPFKDNSVDLIYACHCLEHFPYANVSKVLTEWFRVLKKDGILRLSVPDFDLLIDIYRANGNTINTAVLQSILGGQNYKFNFHKALFNRSSLEDILINIGFKQVQAWKAGCCEFTTFDDWSDFKVLINGKYYPISLNLEAIK